MTSPQRWPHVVLVDPYAAGLAVARRMIGLGARVTVLESEPMVARSRGVEGIVLPYGPANARLRVLRKLAAGSSRCVVLSGTDFGSTWLTDIAGELPANMRAFEHAGSAHRALMHKEQANAIARRAGVRVPWTAYVSSEQELEAVSAQAAWPCVVKPVLAHEWRDRYGERRAFLVGGPEHARKIMSVPLRNGVRMLLSQYIPGGDEDVEEAIVVRLADGSYPVRFGCRKLRQYPPGFGETALGESSALPETLGLAQRVLDEAGFVGVAGVEVKRDAHSGERWFLEVNVRLPRQWGLGDACGAEATPRLVSSLAGEPVGPEPARRSGVRFVQPDLDLRRVHIALKEVPPWRRPPLAYKLMRPYVGAPELGIFNLRDPGPLFALVWIFIGRRTLRLRGRRTRGTHDEKNEDPRT
jgi:D-aspartate ligase